MSPKGSSDFFILKCVSGVEPLAGRRPGDAELCGELSERPACGQAEEELRDDERLASTPTASTKLNAVRTRDRYMSIKSGDLRYP